MDIDRLAAAHHASVNEGLENRTKLEVERRKRSEAWDEFAASADKVTMRRGAEGCRVDAQDA